MIAIFWVSRRCLTTRNSSSVSASESGAVGSSRIRKLHSFWIALAIVLFKWILPLLNDPNGLFSNAVHIPRVRQLLMVLGAGVLLTLPFLPLRSLAVASMVRRIKEREAGDAAK